MTQVTDTIRFDFIERTVDLITATGERKPLPGRVEIASSPAPAKRRSDPEPD